MINAYFISDAHLSCAAEDRENEKHHKIISFFKSIEQKATHLYIVGDFFDFWFEYKYTIPKGHFALLYELKKLINSGVEIHYLAGNHDFALGTFFDQTMGIKTWSDEYTFELNGKRFFLFHGDGLAQDDPGYRILRRILRNRFNQKIFRWLHPDLGFPLARYISGSSRKYTNQMNDTRDESDYIQFAEEKFEQGFDYVLMGHRHNPLTHKKGEHIYINLGDWLGHFTFAQFNGTELALHSYPEEKND